MNPATELAPQLKQLRLSGILDSLDARNRQAIDAKLAYTEFLALLIQDEIARREQKKFGTRLRRAAFRATKTLEGFEFDRLPSTNRALVHELATGRYIDERAPVLIVGPCGTGKSHLAQALGHCAVRQGHDVIFASCAQLLASLNAARAVGTFERKLLQLARVPVLIIDDFGLKPLRAPADEDLHDLIAERYERTATIVTSNLDFTEWDQAFPGNRLLAAGLGHRRPATPQRLLPHARRGLLPCAPTGSESGEKRPCQHPEKHRFLTPQRRPSEPGSSGFYMPIIGGSIVAVSDTSPCRSASASRRADAEATFEFAVRSLPGPLSQACT
jgi:DNA replication protein DnaC